MSGLLEGFVTFWDGAVLWYFLGLNFFYGLLFFLSLGETWRNWTLASRLHLSRRFDRESLPPISVIIPAHDEQETLEHTLQAQLHLEYPHFEVIVVNDGSGDATFELLQEEYLLYEVPPAFSRRLDTEPVRGYYRSWLYPNLLVVDKERGGKSDALNAGLNAARYPLVATVDADTIIARDALPRLVRPFLMSEKVAGSGGTIRIANGCEFDAGRVTNPRLPDRFLEAIQVPEYLRAFLFGRLGWNRLGGNLLVSGAFALYQRHLLLEVGGYPTDSVTEDLDLTMNLHRKLRESGREYTLPFVPDPVAWTEVPGDLSSLGHQRERWHRGLIRSLTRNIGMLFNPRYGKIGMIAVPFFLLGEMLAPIVEVIGYVVVICGIALGLISWSYFLLFLFLALGYMMLLSVWAVALEEFTYRVYPRTGDFFRMVGYALAEPIGYRQMTLFWRLKAFVKALIGDRSWGVHDRNGVHRSREEAGEERGAAADPDRRERARAGA